MLSAYSCTYEVITVFIFTINVNIKKIFFMCNAFFDIYGDSGDYSSSLSLSPSSSMVWKIEFIASFADSKAVSISLW